jgi:hypothetical protein
MKMSVLIKKHPLNLKKTLVLLNLFHNLIEQNYCELVYLLVRIKKYSII